MDFEVTGQNLEELTLLLLYLTSWREKVAADLYIQRAWKGYDFGILDNLEEKRYITSSRRAKSVHLTDEGIEQAKAILKKFQRFLSECEAPILHQDLDDEAIIHPRHFAEDLRLRSDEPRETYLPSRCVATFSYLDDLIKWLKEAKNPEELTWIAAAVFYAGDCVGGDKWDRRKDAKCSVQKEEIMEVIFSVLGGC